MEAKILVLDGKLTGLLDHYSESQNYHISSASSGQEALDRLLNEDFDLFILPRLLFPDGLGDDLLARWRSTAQDINVLTLIVESKSGMWGIVRRPAHSDQAHAYIPFPFSAEDFLEITTRLLAGASTQCKPGDEGYVRHQSDKLGLAFEYPALWVLRPAGYPEKTETFRRSSVGAFGPYDPHCSIISALSVTVYSPLEAVNRPTMEDIVAHEFQRRDGVHQVKRERTVQVAGVIGWEAEYVWPIKGSELRHPTWVRENEKGKIIIAAVEKNERTYALDLVAAEDVFEEFRPVYDHFLATFQFLE